MCSNSTFNNLGTLLLIASCILLPISYISPYIIRTHPSFPPSPQPNLYAEAINSGSLLLPPKGMRLRMGGTTDEALKASGGALYYGLLGSCVEGNGCVWFFQDDFAWQTDKPSWHKVCQALFGAGFVLILIAFLVQIGFLCCKCRNNLSIAITLLISVLATATTILCGIAIGTYSGSSLTDGILTPLSVGGVGGTLAWAFYMGIAGVACSGIAALMFFVDICLQMRKYALYDATSQKVST